MKQRELIDIFRRTAEAQGHEFSTQLGRRGIRVTINDHTINLGPDLRSEINDHLMSRYKRVLGLTTLER